jgi:hypothetical protein
MSHVPCNCNPPAVISTIVGERCHVINERGEWCAIVNESGVYLQSLLVPSQEELEKEATHQAKVAEETSVITARETRKEELKAKLVSGQQLTQQEMSELLLLLL